MEIRFRTIQVKKTLLIILETYLKSYSYVTGFAKGVLYIDLQVEMHF